MTAPPPLLPCPPTAQTKTRVRIYNLQSQSLVKKLQTGVKWISSIDVHPGGDNVIIGSYDRRLSWFDTDLSVRPYKTLRWEFFFGGGGREEGERTGRRLKGGWERQSG